MHQIRRTLAILALSGWFAALISQVAAIRTDDEAAISRWKLTRNRFLLLSSISMNILVLSAACQYVKKLRKEEKSQYTGADLAEENF